MNKTKITAIGLCGRSVFMDVDHFHLSGETLHASALYCEPGGKGYNQAVAAARLGADVSFIGCCGNDADGKECEAFLLKEGITPFIEWTDDAATAFASILTDASGENRVTVYSGASARMSEEFIAQHEQVIAGCDILLLNFEVPLSVNEKAMELAQKHGVKVIFNPAPAIPRKEELLKKAWCITPNESESAVLGFTLEREVITMGASGCAVLNCGKETRLPAEKVNAVNTTGAGDCFNAALAVAIGEGSSLEEAAAFAQKCAALSVTRNYVMPSLPYRSEIKQSMMMGYHE